MKRLFFILICSVFGIMAQAQPQSGTWSIIPHVGVSLSKLPGDYILLNKASQENGVKSTFGSGFTGGVEVMYQNSDQLALSAALNYTQAGCAYKDGDMGDDGKTGAIFHDAKYRLNYLDLPLMAHYYVAKGVALKAGLQLSYFLNGDFGYEEQGYTIEKDGSRKYGENKVMEGKLYKDAFNQLLFSIPIGVSYEYENIVLDARYNVGLSKIHSRVLSSDKMQVITLTVGYKFDI